MASTMRRVQWFGNAMASSFTRSVINRPRATVSAARPVTSRIYSLHLLLAATCAPAVGAVRAGRAITLARSGHLDTGGSTLLRSWKHGFPSSWIVSTLPASVSTVVDGQIWCVDLSAFVEGAIPLHPTLTVPPVGLLLSFKTTGSSGFYGLTRVSTLIVGAP